MSNIPNIKKLTEDKLKSIKDKLLTTDFIKEVGEYAAKEIVKRTKLGFGVNGPEGQQVKLKPLSADYKKFRKTTQLGEFATPGKSNLTLSGKMLNDIEVKVTNETATIQLKSKESKDKTKWQKEQGREWFNLSIIQVKLLNAFIKKRIEKLLK